MDIVAGIPRGNVFFSLEVSLVAGNDPVRPMATSQEYAPDSLSKTAG